MKFNVRLKTVGLFCIGWSYPTVIGPDIQFAKRIDYDGGSQIYIPASSFKGALRSSASRIAESYGFKSCGEIRPERIKDKHEKNGGVCDVCDLLGYPWSNSPSPLLFSDLLPVDKVEMLTLTRARIDDKSMKAAYGALFSIEYIPPGCEFAGTIEIIDAPKEKVILLLLSLAELRLGRIGRGSGFIDLRIEDADDLNKALKDTIWLNLLNELRGWLWNDIP
ncbi:MAG: RAMP superfamily CRISPR-associated protein [Candidatus Bathyarchaeota archaeon]|nr:RAMP superfamily CRISPR-associated protein [Candidatus Bathyarchaeota archaeon]